MLHRKYNINRNIFFSVMFVKVSALLRLVLSFYITQYFVNSLSLPVSFSELCTINSKLVALCNNVNLY